MKKPRKTPSSSIQKELLLEIASKCPNPDCTSPVPLQKGEVDFHHIDGNPSNSSVENLIALCKNCHGKVSSGIISETDVRWWKAALATGKNPRTAVEVPRKPQQKVIKATGGNSGVIFQGDNNRVSTITKIVRTKVVEKYPDESIGRNANMKNYVHYLMSQYYELRKADKSYGRFLPVSKIFPMLNNLIRRNFGSYPNSLSESKFPLLCEFLKSRVDKTIQGKRNLSNGHKNYKDFQEFISLGEI